MLENRISKHSNVTCNTKNEIVKVKDDGLKMIGLSFINQHDSLYLKERLECLDDGMHDSFFGKKRCIKRIKCLFMEKLLIQAM